MATWSLRGTLYPISLTLKPGITSEASALSIVALPGGGTTEALAPGQEAAEGFCFRVELRGTLILLLRV